MVVLDRDVGADDRDLVRAGDQGEVVGHLRVDARLDVRVVAGLAADAEVGGLPERVELADVTGADRDSAGPRGVVDDREPGRLVRDREPGRGPVDDDDRVEVGVPGVRDRDPGAGAGVADRRRDLGRVDEVGEGAVDPELRDRPVLLPGVRQLDEPAGVVQEALVVVVRVGCQ